MTSFANIEKQLIQCGAFSEKYPPVLGTSGIPLFYFINSEYLLSDGGKWETFADHSGDMIAHAIVLYQTTPFKQVILALSELASKVLKDIKLDAISGFQRRDWPFSGPLAHHLKLPHVSVYKNGNIEIIHTLPDGAQHIESAPNIENMKLLNVSDLLTLGSSASNGWLPIFRKNKAVCIGLLNVVSRRQSGEETLKKQGIDAHSLVNIDETFLQKYSKNPDLSVQYFKNPDNTIKRYLEENGADCFLSYMQPDNPKLSRGISFYRHHAPNYLNKNQTVDFENKVLKRFNQSITDIIKQAEK